MGVLSVKLVKVTNLRDTDGVGKSDPYVKFELEQDNCIFDKGYGKQESTKKSSTMSPVYDETFEFGDIPSLNNMVLKVKIMDKDVGLDDEIGSCKIKLEKLHLTEMKSMEVVVDKKKGYETVIHLELKYADE